MTTKAKHSCGHQQKQNIHVDTNKSKTFMWIEEKKRTCHRRALETPKGSLALLWTPKEQNERLQTSVQ
jgi:hypothetical protein